MEKKSSLAAFCQQPFDEDVRQHSYLLRGSAPQKKPSANLLMPARMHGMGLISPVVGGSRIEEASNHQRLIAQGDKLH